MDTYKKLEENLNLVSEIINELTQKSENIEKELDNLLEMHNSSINIFFEISQKYL